MHYFCVLDDAGYLPQFGRGLAARLAGLLWRRSPQPIRQATPAMAGTAADERRVPDPLQPAPYFAIDAGPVRFVGIDTGITGDLDEDQYHWLRRVSLDTPERPKILLTGKKWCTVSRRAASSIGSAPRYSISTTRRFSSNSYASTPTTS
ncbi:MAG: hypothetical protein JO272_00365 [Pseudonocardiales bacterium]|nr:hypothetical protein [Pseudonocardiales bacterium]